MYRQRYPCSTVVLLLLYKGKTAARSGLNVARSALRPLQRLFSKRVSNWSSGLFENLKKSCSKTFAAFLS
jgi:hypothetical protein